MKNKKLKLSIILIIGLGLSNLQAQILDRISISSGGSSTDEVSYVLGEVFNLALSDGNYTFETGTEGGTNNTGGDSYNTIEQIATLNLISCYPNPANDIIYFNFKGKEIKNMSVQIFDISGELISVEETHFGNIMTCNIQKLAPGNYFLCVTDKNGKIIGASKFVKQ